MMPPAIDHNVFPAVGRATGDRGGEMLCTTPDFIIDLMSGTGIGAVAGHGCGRETRRERRRRAVRTGVIGDTPR